jgi:hypothetical protein
VAHRPIPVGHRWAAGQGGVGEDAREGGGDPIWMSGHRRRTLGRGGTWYFGDTPRSSSSAGGGRSMTVYSDIVG